MQPWQAPIHRMQELAALRYDFGLTRAEAEQVLGEPVPQRERSTEYSDVCRVIDLQITEAVWEARHVGLGRTKFMDLRGDLSRNDMEHFLQQTDPPRYFHAGDASSVGLSLTIRSVKEQIQRVEEAGDSASTRLRRNARAFLRQWLELTIPAEMPENDLTGRPKLQEHFDQHREAHRKRRQLIIAAVKAL